MPNESINSVDRTETRVVELSMAMTCEFFTMMMMMLIIWVLAEILGLNPQDGDSMFLRHRHLPRSVRGAKTQKIFIVAWNH